MKFLFEVRTHPGYSVEAYAEAWTRASRIIQRAPGARGTYLHRRIDRPDHLLAIAHWSSKAARDAQDPRADPTVRAILDHHAKVCDTRILGEFEEPEWVVLPEDGAG